MTLQRILGYKTFEMVSNYVTPALSHARVQHRKFSPIDRMNYGMVKLSRNNRRQDRGECKNRKELMVLWCIVAVIIHHRYPASVPDESSQRFAHHCRADQRGCSNRSW